MLYLVIKKGVYRHEIIGVFGTVKLALEVGKKFISSENDDYHQVIIAECVINTEVDDVKEIFEIGKKGDNGEPYLFSIKGGVRVT